MFLNINSIDMQDKLFVLKKHIVKIIVGLIILIILFFIIRGYVQSNYEKNKYSNFESEMVNYTEQYTKNNTFEIIEGEDIYIDLYTLGLEPSSDLKCSKSSGVLINLIGGELNYSPYLVCQGYQSILPGVNNTPTSEDFITLKGLNPMIITGSYTEPGYSVDSGYTVKTNGKIANTPGLYVLNYIVSKGNEEMQVFDRVVIVGNYKREDVVNNLYPTITLQGMTTMMIDKGSNYSDPGFSGYDSIDGDISNKIEVLGTVNPNKVGEYVITYQLANTRGWLTKSSRTVTVVDNSTPPLDVRISTSTAALTNKNVTINIKVSGNNYFYTVLPNNNKTFNANISYEATTNGTYTFDIYDRNYRVKHETVTINNIDSKGPTASCVNLVLASKSIVTVSATDSTSGIAGYSYSNGGIYTSYTSSNVHTFNSANRNAYVKVKDSIGNISFLTCSLDPASVTNNSTITFSMDPVAPKTNLIPCGAGPSYNSALSSKVNAAGLRSRGAVVQAAVYLAADFPYMVPYFWAGKHAKVGISPEWGCDKAIPASGSDRQPMGSIFPYGLDCTGFVKWAFVNGGLSENIIPRYDFDGTSWGNWTPVSHTFSEIASNSQLLNSIKPGDVIQGPGHAALIVGVDDTRIKIAQASGGKNQKVNITFVSKTTGTLIDGNYTFTNIVFMDSFFEMYGK